MNRIDSKFSELQARGEKALIVYIMAGDPDLETTARLVPALVDAGVDLVELGVPFSDPMADGPEIQAAAQRALTRGTTLRQVLALVRDLRRRTEVPLLLMTYYNLLMRYGLKPLATDAAAAGVDGMIIPDLSLEESGPLNDAFSHQGTLLVPLVAPTTTPQRLARLAANSGGFIYCVSRTGVTGAGGQLEERLDAYIDQVRQYTGKPLVVGFGISGPERAVEAARYADGVVMGSAVVRLAASVSEPEARARRVGAFVREVKQALCAMLRL